MSAKFIIIDGVDETGKSSFIESLKSNPLVSGKLVELNFPKILPLSKSLLRINDEKSFELLFAAFEYLDQSKTYILDRFITSNLVYDKVLRGESTSISIHYFSEFASKFNVKQYLFTRPEINEDFIDDKIKMTKDQFNGCIREYHEHGTNHMLLIRDKAGKVIGIDTELEQKLISNMVAFINSDV